MNAYHQDSPDPQAAMPLGDHLEELRSRILRALIAVGLLFLACWFVREHIMRVLVQPHLQATGAFQLDPSLKFRSYLEPITAQLKACAIVALIVGAPYLLYQMWAFIAPGLYKREQRVLIRLGAFSLLCFGAGIVFGYFVFIPLALRFLLTLSGELTRPVLMVGSYLSMFMLMTVALGLVFQTPLLIYHLVRWDIVTIEAVQKHRKGAILAGFVCAAVFTPPDPFTQLMMAIPLILLYDLGALLAAPTREAFLNFARFAGTVLLIGAVVLGYFFFWPVGGVQARTGPVRLGNRELHTSEAARLRRGQTATVPKESLARFIWGGSNGSTLLLDGPGQLRVRGKGSIGLIRGEAMADSTGKGPALHIRTGPALLQLENCRAELDMSDTDTLTVTVLSGWARAAGDGRETRITAGHSATFSSGGKPTDTGPIERRWEERSDQSETR